MGVGPVQATRKVLERDGLTFDQIHLIDINETFAAEVIASLRELGIKTTTRA